VSIALKKLNQPYLAAAGKCKALSCSNVLKACYSLLAVYGVRLKLSSMCGQLHTARNRTSEMRLRYVLLHLHTLILSGYIVHYVEYNVVVVDSKLLLATGFPLLLLLLLLPVQHLLLPTVCEALLLLLTRDG
jgi:hypothetical protein